MDRWQQRLATHHHHRDAAVLGTVICLMAFVSASCSGSHVNSAPSATTRSRASVPGVVTTTTTQNGHGWLDLRTVDWNKVAVPGRSCRHAHDIRLHNGRALLPDKTNGHPSQPGGNGVRYDLLELVKPVIYGDFEGDGHDDAAVSLDCNNNGGTADGAILYSVAIYTGRTGMLTSLGLITPKHQPKDVLPTLLSVTAIRTGHNHGSRGLVQTQRHHLLPART